MRFLRFLFLFVATPLFAATYLVPPDREMIQRSDDIVVATAVATSVEARADRSIVTRSFLRIEEVLKGARLPDSHLVVTEPGGRLGDRMQIIPAAPRYEPGKRYLVFTETGERGETTTFGLQLGRFLLERDLASRAAIHGLDQNLEPFRERMRDARGFIEYIRAAVAQRGVEANYFVDVPRAAEQSAQPTSAFSRTSYMYLDLDRGVRWEEPDVSFVTSGSVALVEIGAVTAQAMAQWNATDTNIRYRYDGRNDSANNDFNPDGINAVQIVPQAGKGYVLAYGGWTNFASTYTLDGESFYSCTEADVVAYDWQGEPLNQACWNSVITHELGHTLGLRHADFDAWDSSLCKLPLDCSDNAVMEAYLNCTVNGGLQAWDRRAATTVYCVPPSITMHPRSQQVGPDNPTVWLSVDMKGTLPLSYEWFAKPEGAASFMPAGTTPSLAAAPQVPTTYHVRVTGQCGTAVTSNDAMITLSCPDAVNGGAAISKLLDNGKYRIGVDDASSASRTLFYTWYSGTAGNAETYVASGNPIEVSRAAWKTSYWAKVTNDCGNAGWSTPATIECAGPSIASQSSPKSVSKNATVTLNVIASGPGPLKYEWFEGAVNTTTKPVGTNAPSFTSAPITASTQFWVRVSNGCGDANSAAINVSVTSSRRRAVR